MEVGLETIYQHKLGWGEIDTFSGSNDNDVRKLQATAEDGYDEQVKKSKESSTSADDTPSLHNGIKTGEDVSAHHKDVQPSTVNSFGENCVFVRSGIASGYQPSDEDINVVDFEVTNSETETTVVLKHLLALSSLREKENETTVSNVSRPTGSTALCTMPAIEESDSEENDSYYESEEIVTTPIVPYSLPIPTVNLLDEDGVVLETILRGREGLEIDGNAANNVDTSSTTDTNFTTKTVYDDLGPSTKL